MTSVIDLRGARKAGLGQRIALQYIQTQNFFFDTDTESNGDILNPILMACERMMKGNDTQETPALIHWPSWQVNSPS